MTKLNIGCGQNHIEGWVNIDKDSDVQPDLLHDIESGLPFEDSSTEEIRCFRILEELDDIIALLIECHRVLKASGRLEILYGLQYVWNENLHLLFDKNRRLAGKFNFLGKQVDHDNLEVRLQYEVLK